MNQEDLIKTVRDNVQQARTCRKNKLIQAEIDWSTQASQRSRLVRWFYGLPNKPWTAKEAEDKILWYLVDTVGFDAIDICDALQTAEKNGLQLRLTVQQVTELRLWL